MPSEVPSEAETPKRKHCTGVPFSKPGPPFPKGRWYPLHIVSTPLSIAVGFSRQRFTITFSLYIRPFGLSLLTLLLLLSRFFGFNIPRLLDSLCIIMSLPCRPLYSLIAATRLSGHSRLQPNQLARNCLKSVCCTSTEKPDVMLRYLFGSARSAHKLLLER